MRDARHADHAAARKRDECDIRNTAEALYDLFARHRHPVDQRSGMFRFHRILYIDRDRGTKDRLYSRRIDDLGPEIGQLKGFFIAHLVDRKCIGHKSWICRQHPVHICPNLERIGF